MIKIKQQLKAIIGGLTAGLTALGTALTDGTVTGPEWIAVAIAALGAYGAVYRTSQPASLPHLSAAELRRMADRAATRERGDG